MPQVNNDSPVFLQVAQMIEDSILDKTYVAGEQVLSTNELARILTINPATARNGMTLLVDQGILFKKRGLGMYITDDAYDIILNKRKTLFENQIIKNVISEAKSLKLTVDDVIEMLRKGYSNA